MSLLLVLKIFFVLGFGYQNSKGEFQSWRNKPRSAGNHNFQHVNTNGGLSIETLRENQRFKKCVIDNCFEYMEECQRMPRCTEMRKQVLPSRGAIQPQCPEGNDHQKECNEALEVLLETLECWNTKCVKQESDVKNQIPKLFKKFDQDSDGKLTQTEMEEGFFVFFKTDYARGKDYVTRAVKLIWKKLDESRKNAGVYDTTGIPVHRVINFFLTNDAQNDGMKEVKNLIENIIRKYTEEEMKKKALEENSERVRNRKKEKNKKREKAKKRSRYRQEL